MAKEVKMARAQKSKLSTMGSLMKAIREALNRQVSVAAVEINYRLTLTADEVRSTPWLAGLGTQPLNPEEIAGQHELHKLIEGILHQEKFLSKREKEVLRLYFGFGCKEHSTFKEVGKVLGISANCACQHLHKAVKKLRRSPKGRQLEAFLK
ncbi:MAG: hypothetical protein NUW02_00965 [Candidatus Campbellbacteria bacterium]|nr:hypothetical protein [Candidatus Campbellbacteria bacterium]